jgi:hypothetical protein
VGLSAPACAGLPSPDRLVPNTVARVSDVSEREGIITKAEFRHALILASASQGNRSVPRARSPRYRPLMRTAIDGLLEAVWLRGQAAEMHVVVTREQVRRKRTRLKRESFDSEAEFREFLREARYTRRDVFERVELQILSARIQRRIEKRIKNKSEEQEIFEEFVAEFNGRWRSRTVCAPAYVTGRCANWVKQDNTRRG